MKVLVTGAAGLLGREVASWLTSGGHVVVPHDRGEGDLADPHHVSSVVDGVDAVVHAAAIPDPVSAEESETFRNNVVSTYNVLEAAGRAGVARVVNVSSISALGIAWSRRDVSPVAVPVTEEHPYVGEDVYGLSKQVGETVALTASRRWGCSVVSLRFPFLGNEERLAYHLSRIHADPGVDRGGLWGWLDVRDAARAVSLALTASVRGHQVVHVTAPDTTALVPTMELVRTYHPGTVVERELGEFESVFSGRKAREVLGFEAHYGWRA
ncbi:NAD-dependent epimerase/dehydratase family protein [Kibdelosporangium lantanae]|uniref:NAD-dependent epimerase/dehydratase family protein n=1 Tax=Kibdelosporangium lantanae TaxID=1497396 RepID=A0ABW3M496_9PSEU